MEEILKKYKLLSCEREVKAFIGKRTVMWAVLQDIHPHIIRAYGNRPVYLKTDWEENKLLILVGVAYPPQQMKECFARLCTDYYDSIPDKVQANFVIDRLS